MGPLRPTSRWAPSRSEDAPKGEISRWDEKPEDHRWEATEGMRSVIYGAQRKSHSLLTVPHVNPADHTGAPGRTRLSHVQSQSVVKEKC